MLLSHRRQLEACLAKNGRQCRRLGVRRRATKVNLDLVLARGNEVDCVAATCPVVVECTELQTAAWRRPCVPVRRATCFGADRPRAEPGRGRVGQIGCQGGRASAQQRCDCRATGGRAARSWSESERAERVVVGSVRCGPCVKSVLPCSSAAAGADLST